MSRHIGVAMSGGGHRASMWALGSMLYLVDAGKQAEVGAIASVSGGSITNGVLAHNVVDLAAVDAARFDAAVGPLVRNVADVGLFFWGPRTNGFVRATLAFAVLTGAGLLTTIVWTAITGLRLGALIALLATLVIGAIAIALFERRSAVMDRALADEHFATAGRPTLLSEVDRPVTHVFCATELQESRHLYMSSRFVYSYANGTGVPADLALSTAVQASACFPGGFNARRLPAGRHRFAGGAKDVPAHDTLVLVDGGVYDNMAEQWFGGYADRLTAGAVLPEQDDIDELLVVNSSALTRWHEVGPTWPRLAREVVDLLADKGVMYGQTTSTRRAALVRSWRASERIGGGQRGAMVHIATDPREAITSVAAAPAPRPTGDAGTDARLTAAHDGRVARARAVLAALDATSADWADIARLNTGVKTVLRKLGRVPTVRLLYGSYVVTMAMTHAHLGYPLLPMPDPNRFAALIDPGYTVAVADLADTSAGPR